MTVRKLSAAATSIWSKLLLLEHRAALALAHPAAIISAAQVYHAGPEHYPDVMKTAGSVAVISTMVRLPIIAWGDNSPSARGPKGR